MKMSETKSNMYTELISSDEMVTFKIVEETCGFTAIVDANLGIFSVVQCTVFMQALLRNENCTLVDIDCNGGCNISTNCGMTSFDISTSGGDFCGSSRIKVPNNLIIETFRELLTIVTEMEKGYCQVE
jgi:hypothetical protein